MAMPDWRLLEQEFCKAEPVPLRVKVMPLREFSKHWLAFNVAEEAMTEMPLPRLAKHRIAIRQSRTNCAGT